MPNTDEILRKACGIFSVTLAELRGKRRFQRIADARHAVAWVLQACGMGPTEIADVLRRHPSTISSSIERARVLTTSDLAFAAKVRALQAAVNRSAEEPCPDPRRMSQRTTTGVSLSLWVAANQRLWATPDTA